MSSNGLQGVGQRELAFIIERLPEENSLPRDVFSLYINIYQDAQKGIILAVVRAQRIYQDHVDFTASELFEFLL